MYFKQFSKKISNDILGTVITEQSHCENHLIETNGNLVYIDKQVTEFNSLEEASNYIQQQSYTKALEQEINTELYEDISENKIANIIQEHHNIKVTDTLIETYIELASSKLFTLDPVVYEIRKLNKLDNLVEGKIDYKLDDGTSVAISQDTYKVLKDLFDSHTEVIDHMRQTKEAFMGVIKQIGEK